MIEECLRLLTLHLAWKSTRLSTDEGLSEEVVKYRELLEEQRNSVLEKVTEFAVGSDSKPCEGVKRAVSNMSQHRFIRLLNSIIRHFTI
jgi:cohesin complex subunit SA-1/2